MSCRKPRILQFAADAVVGRQHTDQVRRRQRRLGHGSHFHPLRGGLADRHVEHVRHHRNPERLGNPRPEPAPFLCHRRDHLRGHRRVGRQFLDGRKTAHRRRSVGAWPLVAESGFTAAEFAARLGTSPSRLSTYLSGKVMPSAALLVRAEGVHSTPAEEHPSDPVEIPFGTRSAQGSAELVDVAGARVEFSGAEQGNQTTVSARDHERGR